MNRTSKDMQETMGPPSGMNTTLGFKDGLPVIKAFHPPRVDADLTVRRASGKMLQKNYNAIVKSMVYADRLRVMQDVISK